MPGRRLEDRVATQLLVPGDSGLAGIGLEEAVARTPRDLLAFHLVADRTDFVVGPDRTPPDALGAIFLLPISRDEIVLVSGEEHVVVSLDEDGERTSARLAAAATKLRRARARTIRRTASRDAFVLVSERLSRAQCAGDVVEALLEHLPCVVDGFAAAVALRSADPLRPTAALYASRPGGGVQPGSLPVEALARLSISGVLTAETCAHEAGLQGVAELLDRAGATRLAFTGLGEHGTMFLLERRPEREFEADDWYLLGVVARQAQDALTRVASG